MNRKSCRKFGGEWDYITNSCKTKRIWKKCGIESIESGIEGTLLSGGNPSAGLISAVFSLASCSAKIIGATMSSVAEKKIHPRIRKRKKKLFMFKVDYDFHYKKLNYARPLITPRVPKTYLTPREMVDLENFRREETIDLSPHGNKVKKIKIPNSIICPYCNQKVSIHERTRFCEFCGHELFFN